MTISPQTQRRILRDFQKIHKEQSKDYVVNFDKKNLDHWNVKLFGPKDTIWEGSCFSLTINFPADYPHTQPDVKFVEIPFRPNVYQNGKICIDILQAQWSSAYDIAAIMTAIQSLLVDPNPESPANAEAANLFVNNKNEYNRRVKLSFPSNKM